MPNKGKSAVTNECHLVRLPVELIARIASYTNASTILTLARTNRALRAASYDTVVFKQIIQTSQRDIWELPCLNLEALTACAGDDAQAWARYAIADEKAISFVRGHAPDTDQVESLLWAPHLAVLNHPFLYSTRQKTPRLEIYSRKPTDHQLLYQAIAFLANPENIPDDKHEFRDDLSDLGSTSAHFSIAQSYSILADIITAWNDDRWTRRATESAQTRGYHHRPAALPTISELGLFVPSWVQQMPPPPFDGTSAADTPAHRHQWEAWSIDHIRRAFTTATNWHGLYTYRVTDGEISARKDAMMTNITFCIIDDPAASEDLVAVEAKDCLDSVGRFDLRGRINWVEKSFVGVKTYLSGNRPGRTWSWDLKISPFGLHGYYYSPPTGRSVPRGYIWLWRQDVLQK